MKVTLRIQFVPFAHEPRPVTCAKTWIDITKFPDLTDGPNPFWREIHRSRPRDAHFGFPVFPGTGDRFSFFLCKSGHRISIKAETEIGPEIVIFGKVVSITKKDEPDNPIKMSDDEFAKLMESEGWELQ